MTAADPALAPYQAWLRRRGTGQRTIQQYAFHAARALGGEDPFERINDRKLSPKYRRVCKAAIISFAKFNKDASLIEEIKEVKLPAPVRQNAKVPLAEDTWRALRAEIDAADYITDPMRAELGIMANRGLRRGDVLRLHRSEVAAALKKNVLSYVAKGERRLEFGVGDAWRPYLELLHDEFSSAGKRAEQVSDLISPRASDENRMESAGSAVIRGLRRVASKIELGDHALEDVTPHLLRFCYATKFFNACGRDPRRLQEHMQWSSLEVAMIYVGSESRASLDDIAAEMMK
jgi:site-specific recombinase XerD